MAVSAKFYGKAFLSAFNKEIDLDSDTLKVMLCTSAYVPDQDAHRYKSDVTNEVTGAGYTAGGAALTSPTVTYTGATNTFALDAADVAWPGSTLTARYAVVYDAIPATDATRPLLCYVDFGADVSTSVGTFTITWDAAGITTVTVS
jgi:hypothetical protein